MEQRVSLITLGVRDLERAIAFYRAIAWREHPSSVVGEVAFFLTGGSVFALWGRAALAADSAVDDAGGWGGVTLAHNVRTRAEVDAVLGEAANAGARIGRAAADTEWGGYSGIFIDPEGHPWEVAYNPGWPLDGDGNVNLG